MYNYENSLPAFIDAKKTITKTQITVLDAIKLLGACSDHQISEFLNWPINRVTPRRGELVESNRVKLAFRGKDFTTGRSVNFWQLNQMINLEN